MPLILSKIEQSLPPIPQHNLLPKIQEEIIKANQAIVVLDDDPTGTQTVYDVPVLTDWSREVIAAEFRLGTPLFYILTNSRSLYTQDAAALASEIGANLIEAAHQTGRDFRVISRGDSTLRGHYPVEVDALLLSLGQEEAIRIIAPAFFEGGRYTIHNTHYVQEKDQIIPVGETPFAQDKTFGFKSSDLTAWLEEKTGGHLKAKEVFSFDIEELRTSNAAELTAKLNNLPPQSTCIINALAPYDLHIVVLALLQLKRSFLCRTAASFVAAMGGMTRRPLLTPAGLVPQPASSGGLTVVGSYVPKSGSQLQHLLASGLVSPLELNVPLLLDDSGRPKEIKQVTGNINQLLANGKDVVLYTSRKLISGENKEESLAIGQKVSAALTAIVSGLAVQPSYLIAKGGITSSDLATKALGVKRGWVLGQLLPGVPVWKLGFESKYPNLCYVVFPGNVGNEEALTEIVLKLGRSQYA